MRKIYINVLLFLYISTSFGQVDRSVIPVSGPPPSIEIGQPVEFELNNGLKVLMVENHKLPRVSANLLIDNPPLEGSNKNGIYSMTSSMLGKGTKLIPKDVFVEEIDFLGLNLSFEPIGDGREVIFEMAREVCNKKGNLGAIFNASNEIAVDAFLTRKIDFVDIYQVIQRTFNHFSCSKVNTLDDIFDYDKQARIQAEKVIKSLH